MHKRVKVKGPSQLLVLLLQLHDNHKTKQDNHKTFGTGNEIGRAGYGFEKSSSGCCASRQSKDNYKSQGCQSEGKGNGMGEGESFVFGLGSAFR